MHTATPLRSSLPVTPLHTPTPVETTKTLETLKSFGANTLVYRLWAYLLSLEPVIAAHRDLLLFAGSIIAIMVVCVGIYTLVLRRVLRIRKKIEDDVVFLELTPPTVTEQSAYTTQQLFALIHDLGRHAPTHLFVEKPTFSFEILSTQEHGIRYLIKTNRVFATILQKNWRSYVPEVKIAEIVDYVPQTVTDVHTDHFSILEFTLHHHFAYPLQKQEQLEQHDPIAYLTGMMTKLSPGELVSLQLVVVPTQPRQVNMLLNMILSNSDILSFLKNQEIPLIVRLCVSVAKHIVRLCFLGVSLPFWLISNLTTQGNTPLPSLPFPASPQDQEKTIFEKETITSIHQKIAQPLFEASVRVLILMKNTQELNERSRGFASSFAPFTNAGHQSLKRVHSIRLPFMTTYLFRVFQKRLLSLRNTSLFSLSEVADLYHFPFTSTTKTEDLVKLHWKELPAPLSLKKTNDLDVVFAKNTYGDSTTMIGLTEEERRRHMYILGATGTGKSTLLLSMILQDIQHNKGLCVIDPHGDLIEKVLAGIPEHRINDVVYFNPDDIGYPIGLNLLEVPTGLSGDTLLREQELIAESIISLFHKLYPDRNVGPRMEYILRNTIHTAFTIPNATLFTIFKLLVDGKYRTSVVNTLTDQNLQDFWKQEFNKAGDYQKVSMVLPITNKIGRFLFSPSAKRILEQERSSISFDDIMDSGKILLCNLSKGKIGEDTSEVFGILLLTKIQLAALKRARTHAENRKDFYLYVDEFQNFATPAFAQILSEARKYKLNAILAHQTTSQVEDPALVNVTLANIGTIICFRTANPEDERKILPQFVPAIQAGDIASLPAFHFYMKVSVFTPEEPFSGETIPVESAENTEQAEKIIAHSRHTYAHQYMEPSSQNVPQKHITVSKIRTPSRKRSIKPMPQIGHKKQANSVPEDDVPRTDN